MWPDLTGIGDEAAPDLSGQVAVAHELGWSELELRTVDGVPMAELSDSAFRSVADRLNEAGLGVTALASRIGNWARPITTPFTADLAELDALAEQCAVLGCRHIRIMSYPNDGLPDDEWRRLVLIRVRALARRAEQNGVVLLHENCSGWAGSSGQRAVRLLEAVDSPALRLLFDIGNGIEHGYDSAALLRPMLPYVEHVHVKDAVHTPQGARYVLPGDGDARVAKCLRLLLSAGYRGKLSLEPHIATRPHEGLLATGDGAARFVAAARQLDQLLHTEVLPALTDGVSR